MHKTILFLTSCTNPSLDTFHLAIGRAFIDELRSNVPTFNINEFEIKQGFSNDHLFYHNTGYLERDLDEASALILVDEQEGDVSVKMFTRREGKRYGNDTSFNTDSGKPGWKLPETLLVHYHLHEENYVTGSSLLNAVNDTRRTAKRFSRLIES